MKHYKINFDHIYYAQRGDPSKQTNSIVKFVETDYFHNRTVLNFSYKISHGFHRNVTILNPLNVTFSLILRLVVTRDWNPLNPRYYSPWNTIPSDIEYSATVDVFFSKFLNITNQALEVVYPNTNVRYYDNTQVIYGDYFYQKGFDINYGDPPDIPKLNSAYAAPYQYLSPRLPITAEFLFDYEDILLPLKEECPAGSSKLLTNNYPGYICIDYDPIEKAINNIRNIIKGI